MMEGNKIQVRPIGNSNDSLFITDESQESKFITNQSQESKFITTESQESKIFTDESYQFITDESEENENQTQVKKPEFKVLCISYNLEVIKPKGFHPKFLIVYLHASFLLILMIEIIVFGYGTNWNIFVFPPMLITRIMQVGDVFYKLGKTPQEIKKIEKNKFFIAYLSIAGILAFGALINSVVIKTPFDNPAYYLAGVYPDFFLVFIILNIAQDKAETPSWLPQYRQPVFPSHSKSKITERKPVKDEFQIYRKVAWVSFVVTTMIIDVVSDLYFGIDLVIIYCGKNLVQMIIGIVILLCCFGDLVLVNFMMLFPNWVSYTSHLIAFFMEIPNAVLTVTSFWMIYQMGQLTEENKIVWGLSIFSFLTTAIDALIHIMYILDRWTVHNAILRLQQM